MNNNITDEQKERLMEYDKKIAYKNGVIEGIKMYSWMKNGVTYVGTTGKTLKRAIEEIEDEIKNLEL